MLDLVEAERRRHNQYSIVDFRFSRLHESVPYVHQVEGSRVQEPTQPLPDPVATAAETAARYEHMDVKEEGAIAGVKSHNAL